MINIGKYIEIAINWMTEHWAHFFDVVNNIIGGFIDAFQNGLLWIPFYIMIAALTVLAWNSRSDTAGFVPYLWNGLLGTDYADRRIGPVLYRDCPDPRRTAGNMDGA